MKGTTACSGVLVVFRQMFTGIGLEFVYFKLQMLQSPIEFATAVQTLLTAQKQALAAGM